VILTRLMATSKIEGGRRVEPFGGAGTITLVKWRRQGMREPLASRTAAWTETDSTIDTSRLGVCSVGNRIAGLPASVGRSERDTLTRRVY
jgi:hypothetical protein